MGSSLNKLQCVCVHDNEGICHRIQQCGFNYILPCNRLSFSVSSYPGFFRWLYERFRFPAAPVYGGFPVKFQTFLGDPIPYDPNINAAELADKVG